jgi:hypothetical protein
VLFSCRNPVGDAHQETDRYFSFKSYFKSQARQLKSTNVKLEKTIIKDGISETKNIDSVKWENELKLFADADLNKKAWIDLYRIDSINADGKTIVTYTSTDSSLQVKNATIIFDGDAVSEIRIESSLKNFYYESFLHLDYIPGVRYYIKGSQMIRISKNHSFDIEGKILYRSNSAFRK